MNCREAIALLAEQGDSDSPPSAGWRFKLHLWCCGNCRNYANTYDATIRLEKSAYRLDDDASATVPEELVAQILAAVR